MKFLLTICLLTLTSVQLCRAQQNHPLGSDSTKFRANLQLFFPDMATEQQSKIRLMDSIRRFENENHGTLNILWQQLDTYENLIKGLQRHYQYFRLAAEKNKTDSIAKTKSQQVAIALDVLDAHVDSMLQLPVFTALTPAQLKANRLDTYFYLLTQEKINSAHSLSPQAERLSGQLSIKLLDQLTDRYDNLMDTLKVANGELFAATLIDITTEKNAVAIAHHYKSAPEELYAERLQLPIDSVKQILNKVAAFADLLKQYQDLPKQPINAYSWTPLAFADVRELIVSALHPLGKTYTQHFLKLLNPQNGLLDIAAGPNRAAGGNSFGFVGTPIGLYMKSYDGGYRNVFTLIHEGGHAIHRQLMSEEQLIPSYYSGPNFMFEAFAMLNELLLLDELEKKATTPEAKTYFTRLFIDKLAHEIFTSAEEAFFEQNLNDSVLDQKVHNFHDINQLYTAAVRNYDHSTMNPSAWIGKRLVFEDPLYNVNYLFAILVTCKLYELHLSDPGSFARNYNMLLKNGFSDTAKTQLKKYMHIDLNNDELLSSAAMLFNEKLKLIVLK